MQVGKLKEVRDATVGGSYYLSLVRSTTKVRQENGVGVVVLPKHKVLLINLL